MALHPLFASEANRHFMMLSNRVCINLTDYLGLLAFAHCAMAQEWVRLRYVTVIKSSWGKRRTEESAQLQRPRRLEEVLYCTNQYGPVTITQRMLAEPRTSDGIVADYLLRSGILHASCSFTKAQWSRGHPSSQKTTTTRGGAHVVNLV